MIFKNKRSILLLLLILTLVFVPTQMLVRAETISDNNTELINKEENIELDNTQVNQPTTEDWNVEFVPSDFDPNEWLLDTTNTSAYVLQRYIGNKTDIYIPGKHTDGKQVIISSLYSEIGLNELGLMNKNVENIKIEAVDGIKVKVIDNDASNGFARLFNLKTADLRGLDVSNIESMSRFFMGNDSLTHVDLTGLDTSNVSEMNAMFQSTIALEELDLSNLDTSSVYDMRMMFLNSASLKKLNVSNWDTRHAHYMHGMFQSARSLEELDLSNWDTRNVADMSHMFHGTTSLKKLDLSNLNTSNVTNMGGMFSLARSLTTLDVSNFNTNKVIRMDDMFSFMDELKELDLSNFDTSNVLSMNTMFGSDVSLTRLNISNFNTSNVTELSGMFGLTPKLEILDLSSFHLSDNVSDMSAMFYNDVPQERLVISTNPKLVDYDYQGDNNIPFNITVLDANGGRFADGATQQEYSLPSVVAAIMPTVSQEYDAFLQQRPEKKDNIFAGWDKELPLFPVSILSMRNTAFTATWKTVPKLEITPQIVELPLNDPSWGTTLMATDGVSWSDAFDTNGVFHSVTTMAPTTYQDDSVTAVDIHTPGVYHVRYVITNSSGETVEGTRIYTVGAQAVGTEYALFANDFDRNLTDAVNDSDTEIILKADAQAILLADGMTLGTVEVLSKTGYGTTAGTYPITFTVSEEDTVHASINAYIYDEVIPSLPATGEQTMEVMMVAVIILLISLIGLITVKQKQKN